MLSQLPQAKTGWTVATQAFKSTGEPGADDKVAEYGHPRDDWYLEAAKGNDFVGVQAYTRTFVGPDGPLPVRDDVETTLTGWEFYPQAAADGLRAAWELTGGVPLVVTENGIATADDTRRIAYTQASLEGIHDCLAEGIDVRGYCTGACSTTTSGPRGTGRRSASSRGTGRRSSGRPSPARTGTAASRGPTPCPDRYCGNGTRGRSGTAGPAC